MTTQTYVFREPLALTGINRDQTQFQSRQWVDGANNRFYNGEPRKMGGSIAVNLGINQICRGMFGAPSDQTVALDSTTRSLNVYYGTSEFLNYFTMNDDGISNNINNVTPIGYATNDNSSWVFEQHTIPNPDVDELPLNYIIALVAPDLDNLGSSLPGQTYYQLNGVNSKFADLSTALPLNGYVLSVPPFLVLMGQGGLVAWSDENNLNFSANNFQICGNTRAVCGKVVRGGSNPSFLTWTLTGLYRLTYNPSASTTIGRPVFDRESISGKMSIISKNSVVEVPEIASYAWTGTNCFYIYDGSIRELKNSFNKKWFFNNLNKSQLRKCFAFTNPSDCEIWFVGPLFGSEEANHAVIYNYESNSWYDTPYNRSAAIPAQYLSYPVASDSKPNPIPLNNSTSVNYPFWMHEFGVDEEILGVKYAIKSYVRSHLWLMSQTGQTDVQTRTYRLEPDLFLDGNMTFKIYSQKFPNSPPNISQPYLLRGPDGLVTKVDIKKMGKYNSFYFESNEVGGFYQFGTHVLDLIADQSERPSG